MCWPKAQLRRLVWTVRCVPISCAQLAPRLAQMARDFGTVTKAQASLCNRCSISDPYNHLILSINCCRCMTNYLIRLVPGLIYLLVPLRKTRFSQVALRCALVKLQKKQKQSEDVFFLMMINF